MNEHNTNSSYHNFGNRITSEKWRTCHIRERKTCGIQNEPVQTADEKKMKHTPNNHAKEK
jgi:hypothetical protein